MQYPLDDANSEIYLRVILDNLREAVIITEENGIIRFANPAVTQMFGYSPQDLAGAKMDVLMPEIAPDEDFQCEQGMIQVAPHQMQYLNARRKSGELFPAALRMVEVHITARPVWFGFICDLSAHQDTQTRLHHEVTLKQALLDSANLIIITTDLHGIIRIFNNAAERMLGYSAEDMIGKRTPIAVLEPQELKQRIRQLGQELEEYVPSGFEGLIVKARLGFVDEAEWTYVGRDGTRFPVLLSITALTNEDARIIGYLMMGTDISERKKIDRIKSEFISTVSHELRTPLTSIRGSLGLVVSGNMGEIPAKAKALLEIANKNAVRLSNLINDILDIEKIEAGKMKFHMEPATVADIVAHTIEANHGYASQYQVELKFDNRCADGIADLDKNRFEQVLSNLISNACKFSPNRGEVSITLCRRDNFLRLEVSDQGPGISLDFQKQIFNKFAQADSADNREKGGTGLGLSISKAIMERMDGHIGFHSTPGQGCTFFVELPCRQDPVVKTTTSIPNPRQGHILVCEDDIGIAELLKFFIERAGYGVSLAHTLKSARGFLETAKFNAMILDLMLPDGNGLSFLHELRGDKRFLDMPVIVVSAKAGTTDEAITGKALHIVNWLPKPIDANRLVQTLEQALRRHPLAQSKPCILHVEDDPDIRQIVSTILKEKAELAFASNLEGARSQLKNHRFDLILLDMSLPDGSGTELLSELHELDTDLPVVIFSAHEVPETVALQVKAALVKTRTSNQTLEQTILQALHYRSG